MKDEDTQDQDLNSTLYDEDYEGEDEEYINPDELGIIFY